MDIQFWGDLFLVFTRVCGEPTVMRSLRGADRERSNQVIYVHLTCLFVLLSVNCLFTIWLLWVFFSIAPNTLRAKILVIKYFHSVFWYAYKVILAIPFCVRYTIYILDIVDRLGIIGSQIFGRLSCFYSEGVLPSRLFSIIAKPWII